MIEIDISYFYSFLDQFVGLDSFQIAWILLFKYWGWVVIVWIFLRYLAYPEYMNAIQANWYQKEGKYTLLAVDVPKLNEQSMQAMENFFDHILGAHGTQTKWQKYIQGQFQLSMSVELVSIEGNIQYIVRCPINWRNLIEAAVYAQFPQAEITEVEDYVNNMPKTFPDDKYDIWGVEFTLSAPEYLPIKSWRKFEHNFTDAIFVDPMAALLETMASIGEGEQMWLQITMTPIEVGWGAKYKKEVDKLMEKALPTPPPSIVGSVLGQTGGMVSEFTTQLAGLSLEAPPKEEKAAIKFPNLSPFAKERVEEVERKLTHLAYNCKIRYIYLAEKDKMNKTLGANAIVGCFKQWTDMNANGLKPELKFTGTSRPYYYLVEYRKRMRKNIIMAAYRSRSTQIGCKPKALCTEELASLWHFPSINVKAPMLKKTEFIKAAAPVGLPFGKSPAGPVQAKNVEEVIAEKSANLPTFDYDNDAFEMQFAKDKPAFVKSRPARNKLVKELAEKETAKMKKLWQTPAKPAEESVVADDFAEIKPQPDAAKPVSPQPKEPSNTPNNLPFID